MSVFDRAQRPNPSNEERGVITSQGLLAHGVKPNPFVSPASYLGHTGTESEKGQKNLERMCQAWTEEQIQIGIKAESEPQKLFGPHKARIGSSTPLNALLLQMEKGHLPSDTLIPSCTPGSVGLRKSFNIYSGEHTEASLAAPVRRSPKSAMEPRLLFVPEQDAISSAAWRAGFRLDAPSAAQEKVATYQPSPRSTPKPTQTSKKPSLSIKTSVEKKGSKSQQLFQTRNGLTSFQRLTQDEAWLDEKIKSALDTLMAQRISKEDRLVEVVERANQAIETLLDESVLDKQNKEISRLEKELQKMQLRLDLHDSDDVSVSRRPGSHVKQSHLTSVAPILRSRRHRQALAKLERREEDKLRRDINALDTQLYEMQSFSSSTSSRSSSHLSGELAEDESALEFIERDELELEQRSLDEAYPLFLDETNKLSSTEFDDDEEEEEKVASPSSSSAWRSTGMSSVVSRETIQSIKDQVWELEKMLKAQEQTSSTESNCNHHHHQTVRGTRKKDEVNDHGSKVMRKKYRNFYGDKNFDDSSDSSDGEEEEEEEKQEGPIVVQVNVKNASRRHIRRQKKEEKKRKNSKRFSPVVSAVKDIITELRSPRFTRRMSHQ